MAGFKGKSEGYLPKLELDIKLMHKADKKRQIKTVVIILMLTPRFKNIKPLQILMQVEEEGTYLSMCVGYLFTDPAAVCCKSRLIAQLGANKSSYSNTLLCRHYRCNTYPFS